MDGSIEWNGLLDTPPICYRSTTISAFGTEHAQLTLYTVKLDFAKYYKTYKKLKIVLFVDA